jgi:hypothetical protein
LFTFARKTEKMKQENSFYFWHMLTRNVFTHREIEKDRKFFKVNLQVESVIKKQLNRLNIKVFLALSF